jgi:hypothetical protein
MNTSPELAVALMSANAPALYQVPDVGVTDPSADGDAVVVNWYCVVKLAVYVAAEDGAVTVCEGAPLSDQLLKTYCVPVLPAWVAVVAIVCELFAAQVNVCEDV